MSITRSSRNSSLDELGDKDAPVGSRPWAVYFIRRARYYLGNLDSDANGLRRVVEELRNGEAWKACGLLSFDEFCARELKVDVECVAAVLQAEKGETVKQALQRQAEKARAQAKVRQGERTDLGHSANGTKLRRGSNSAEHLLRRIARDHPEILDRYESGEFKSVRQAAIDAGIIKVKSPLEKALAAYRKLEPSEREAFLKLI